jgi:hypothetical protein
VCELVSELSFQVLKASTHTTLIYDALIMFQQISCANVPLDEDNLHVDLLRIEAQLKH